MQTDLQRSIDKHNNPHLVLSNYARMKAKNHNISFRTTPASEKSIKNNNKHPSAAE